MATEKTKLEYIRLDALKEYERNTRTHSHEQVEQIKRSITEFGFTNPVLVDEDNVLIAGHGRTTAARALGMKEVPAIRLKNLTEAQRKALRIADNQLALNAGWDEELLRVELAELKTEDFDLDLCGFNTDELTHYLQEQDIDGFFERAESQQGETAKEKKKECVKCPHCGELVEL